MNGKQIVSLKMYSFQARFKFFGPVICGFHDCSDSCTICISNQLNATVCFRFYPHLLGLDRITVVQ